MPSGERPRLPVRALRVAIEGLLDGTAWTNIQWFHLNGSGTIANSDLEQLVGDIGQAFGDAFEDSLSVVWLPTRAHGVLEADGDTSVEAFAALTHEGGVTGISLPANCAACISWHVSAHYRGGHPRTYLAGVPATKLINAWRLDPAWTGALAIAAAGYHNAVESLTVPGVTSVEHGVYSYVLDGAWRTTPLFRRFTAAVNVDQRLDSQRRRLGPDIA